MSPVLTLVYLSYKIIIIIMGFSQNFANLNLHLSRRTVSRQPFAKRDIPTEAEFARAIKFLVCFCKANYFHCTLSLQIIIFMF